MKYKITYHMMPWEVDYALLSFTQFKKSSYYLNLEESGDEIEFDIELNLSKKLFNWRESRMPKQFFIDKYHQILNLLSDYNVSGTVYEGPHLWGHLNHQRRVIDPTVDFYISVCPDMYFSEHLLSLMITVSKQIDNEYFMVTPEIYKMWDGTWDEITASEYLNVPYDDWNKGDIFDLRVDMKNQECFKNNEVSVNLEPTQKSKWAGWFDLYSKSFYEDLCPFLDEWAGYGPWDWYSLILTEHAKSKGIDFQQYVLRGQRIFEYSTGNLLNGGLSGYYKTYIKMNDIPDQRKQFESKMEEYLQKAVKSWEKTVLI